MTKPNVFVSQDADFADRLSKAVQTIISRGSHPTRGEIIDLAMSYRPRAYYLSFDYICRRLMSLRKDEFFAKSCSNMTPKRALWVDINDKVDAYMRRHKRATISDAVSHLLNFCTPERFYISRVKALEVFVDTFGHGNIIINPKAL